MWVTEPTTTSLHFPHTDHFKLFNLANVAKGGKRAGHGARSSLTISQQKNTEHGRGGGDESERSGTSRAVCRPKIDRANLCHAVPPAVDAHTLNEMHELKLILHQVLGTVPGTAVQA